MMEVVSISYRTAVPAVWLAILRLLMIDRFITMDALYQLSYRGVCRARNWWILSIFRDRSTFPGADSRIRTGDLRFIPLRREPGADGRIRTGDLRFTKPLL